MQSRKKLLALALTALLVTTAGCSGLSGGNDATATPTGSVTPTETATETATDTDEPGTATNGTPTDDGVNDSNGGAAATTGTMAVVVGGDRLDLSTAVDGSASFRIDGDRADQWHTNDTPTLADALSKAGVDATPASLSYDGETFEADAEGTTLVYRVNGEPVDPTTYELEDGDEVWVLAYTDDADGSTPGNHISPERLHIHGSMEFRVDGESLNFSREKWQAPSHNDHFHFEGGHADPWHAHSWSVTLAYALSTLDGINATEQGITYNGTTYTGDEVRVTVNGESVDPTGYYLKDGDSVTIVLDSEN